jgi:high-affinity nickel permease
MTESLTGLVMGADEAGANFMHGYIRATLIAKTALDADKIAAVDSIFNDLRRGIVRS